MIQRILDEEGVPPELIHLAQAESGFLPRAVSRARATGMWQFMNWRGNQYGLMQTRYTDDRLDPEKATRAAARHLRDLYHTFGDWYLAIAAYNCGPGVIERAVERTGYADFWELRARRVIPAETTNYVPIILAMTIMAKNSVEYGLQDVAPDAPLEYDTVAITSPTSLSLVADMIDVPVSELLAMNPALLKSTAPEGYSLHVPRGTGSEVMAGLRLVPSERRASWRLHRVESGETLAAIGKRYGTAPGTIAAANNLASESPEVGQRLLIPAAFHETDHAVKRVPATRSTKRTASRKACPRTTPVVRRASTAPSSAARTSPSKTGAKTSPAVKRSGPRVLSRTASARNPGAQGN
jgi:membrane-bound lytic murein transglycosylase D